MKADPPLIDVRDLSIAFAQGGERKTVVDRVSFRLMKGKALALVGEFGFGQVRHRPGPCAPAAATGCQLSDRRDFVSRSRRAEDDRRGAARDARRERHHGVPGADDLAQSAAHHRAPDRRDHRAASRPRRGHEKAHRRAFDRGRHRRPGRAARRLSAPALGRTAPARDDRHGARQPPGPLDRRRADDRPRRHRAGADPEATEGPAAEDGHGDAVHHPRPQRRAPHRRRRDRDAEGRDRRSGPNGRGVRQPAASLHAGAARRRA